MTKYGYSIKWFWQFGFILLLWVSPYIGQKYSQFFSGRVKIYEFLFCSKRVQDRSGIVINKMPSLGICIVRGFDNILLLLLFCCWRQCRRWDDSVGCSFKYPTFNRRIVRVYKQSNRTGLNVDNKSPTPKLVLKLTTRNFISTQFSATLGRSWHYYISQKIHN